MLNDHDVLIIGGGAAGIVMTRELSARGVRVCLVESGGVEETADHEALNAVEVTGTLGDAAVRRARQDWHAPQMRFWSAEGQQFGVRNRVLGGSTAAWAGKVAPFSPADFERRAWLAETGWPIGHDDLAPFVDRAARHLELGPLLNDEAYRAERAAVRPEAVTRMAAFDSHFWQFARSRRKVTDVTRMGDDFRRDDLDGVTVVTNATAARVLVTRGKLGGVECLSSLGGGRRVVLGARQVVLAAGAIENARLMLLSGLDRPGVALAPGLPAIGRYLMDHPTVRIGTVESAGCAAAARLMGFLPLRRGHRGYMYAHGLALRPEWQERGRLPNMAAFASVELSRDDPVAAFGRLARGRSGHVLADLGVVLGNGATIASALGRKLLESPRVPDAIKRLVVDAAVWVSADFVARDYLARGGSRKLDRLHIELIAEQSADAANRITLSDARDSLGLRRARIRWEPGAASADAVMKGARLLIEDLRRAGVTGFVPIDAVAQQASERLVLRDMAHTAGTTRMGRDPAQSVVDPDCQVHGVPGLHIAGASVFPTIGHANPTLMILAVAIRLADHIAAHPEPISASPAMADHAPAQGAEPAVGPIAVAAGFMLTESEAGGGEQELVTGRATAVPGRDHGERSGSGACGCGDPGKAILAKGKESANTVT